MAGGIAHLLSLRPVRWTLGLALIPVGLALSAGFVRGFRSSASLSANGIGFLVGVGSYLVLHFLLYKPVFLHVVGHELTHALFAALFGGRVKTLNVSAKGGVVLVSKSNLLVALAPYFIPLYTLMALVLFWVVMPAIKPYAAGLVGATVAFHGALTFFTLKSHQPDLEEGGVLLSLALIYVANLLLLAGILALLLPEWFAFGSFLHGTWHAAQWAAGKFT